MTRRRRLLVLIGVAGVLAALALGTTAASGDTGPPGATVPPIAYGSPGVGKQLTVDSGSWSVDVAFAYRWLRCDTFGGNCTDIAGATGATYIVAAADADHVLVAQVTATGAAGTSVALSNALGPVADRPPGPMHRPSIDGPKKAGRRVYEAADRWTGAPDTFAIRWLRCSATGRRCAPITGRRLRCAGGSCLRVDVGKQWDYTLTAKDVGHRLRVLVRAWNGAGRATSTSKPTPVVTR